MGFREFISSFRYRQQLGAELERYQNIKPPANPSQRYIDKLIARLLNERTAWDAHRELSLMGPAIVPSLIAALQDQRYHRTEWEKFSQVPAPLETTLELLASHAGGDLVKITLSLMKSSSIKIRKTIALHLSSVGRAVTIPTLQELMRDEDGYVRSFTRIGIHRAVTEGRADAEFRRQAYDLLLLQCDQYWGHATNDAAATIIALDPARAAVDLADARWLNLTNRNCHQILKACNEANIPLPEGIVRQLLEATLPQAVGERCYPNQYVAAAALQALAMRQAYGVREIAASLLEHEARVVKEAAAKALATLAGASDPSVFVFDRVKLEGYEALSHEQGVVYCALVFDAEVCNGGLMQFFGNSSGAHAVDTLEALSELGHKEAYAALDTAIKCVGPLAREANQELRLTGFEGRWDDLRAAFDPLERAYYATNDKLRQAWLLYAVRHVEHFRR